MMGSLTTLFRFGRGPSSSHTMAPRRAAERFLERAPAAARFRVCLFASLAATGKGHLTDAALRDVFGDRPLELAWRAGEELPLHPNGMRFEALDAGGRVTESWEVYSVGGGALRDAGGAETEPGVYLLESMESILAHCEQGGLGFPEYVAACEGEAIGPFLDGVARRMREAIERGLAAGGVLPGGLGLPRKARALRRKADLVGPMLRRDALLAAFAYAVAEENAAGGLIVTAPTCGASGVLPAVLHFLETTEGFASEELRGALATAGLVGALIRHNGSISGAEVGCQGEIGAACAMAAAAATQLRGGGLRQIEYAAEMGLEHHLGLTCDPVGGLVQIPCIERNAHAAARALSCSHFALLSDGSHKVPFDTMVAVMKETGQALPALYRETSAAGIARAYRNP